MDRELIIRLAREAGLEILSLDGQDEVGCGDGYHIQTDLIEHFAALVADYLRSVDIHSCHHDCQRPMCVAVRAAVKAEREECARICDATRDDEWTPGTNVECAAAIRSRT